VLDHTPLGLPAARRVWSQAVAVTEVGTPGGAVPAVRVPCWVGNQVRIGLGDLMHRVGDGGALRWRLFSVDFIGDVRAVWPQGHEEVEAQSRQSGACWLLGRR
jgi:hypothetical protein